MTRKTVAWFSPHLFVARQGVETDGDEVAFFRKVAGHLPNLFSNWSSPVELCSSVILRDAGHEFSQTNLATNESNGSDYDHAVLDSHIDFIANRNLSFLEYLLVETDALTISPLLNFGGQNRFPRSPQRTHFRIYDV